MKQKKSNNSVLSTPIDFKPGFHYGNKKNLVSKNLDDTRKASFQLREELLSNKKSESKSIFSVLKNLFCCQQEKHPRNSPKTTQRLPKQPVILQEGSAKGSQASLNFSSGPKKSLDATLIENFTQSTANSNNQIHPVISNNCKDGMKENGIKITKTKLLENDLFGLPIETLFILRKDVGMCNLLAKIKFVDFFINDSCANLSKKSLSNPCSNLHFFNLATFEKDPDFASFKKESLTRKISMNNFKEKKESGNWTENLKVKKSSIVDQQILLSFHEKNMILDYDQWRNVTPEQCAKYTAKRIKNRGVILDAFCGIGGNLIYFAKENEVIGIDINLKTLLFAKHNAFNMGVLQRTHLIQGDFLQMGLHRMNPDVIFLNPEMMESVSKDNFSIFTHITPDITSTLLRSYNLCRNIILCLPKYAKIDEIASLFSTIFKRTDRKIEDITIEIEYFFINGELEQIQVYLGDINQISTLEEIDFLYNYLCKGQLEKTFLYKDIRNFFKFLLKKLKLPKLCFYLLKIEEISDCDHSQFQKFLNVLRMYQEISSEDQEKFFGGKKMEECGPEKHHKTKEDISYNNLIVKNSLDEKIMPLSYYSGTLFTLGDEKRKKLVNFDTENSSFDNEIWLDSINY